MIYFPPLRTPRLTVELREITIRESLMLAAMPPHMEQAALTKFLTACAQVKAGPANPAEWTAQERLLVLCHYLAAVAADGPDFSVGEGTYSDYADFTLNSAPAQVPAGEVGGDQWHVQHLTGAMAEAIERLEGELPDIVGRNHWLIGGMAAQLVREGDEAPPDPLAGDYDETLLSRMRVVSEYPEGAFSQLMWAYFDAREALNHHFAIDFSEHGIVAKTREGAAESLPPARFPVSACLTEDSRRMVGKPRENRA